MALYVYTMFITIHTGKIMIQPDHLIVQQCTVFEERERERQETKVDEEEN